MLWCGKYLLNAELFSCYSKGLFKCKFCIREVQHDVKINTNTCDRKIKTQLNHIHEQKQAHPWKFQLMHISSFKNNSGYISNELQF